MVCEFLFQGIYLKKKNPGMMVHAFNPSTQEVELGNLCEFELNMVYRMSSRTGWNTEKPCLKQTNKPKTQEIEFSPILQISNPKHREVTHPVQGSKTGK